MPKLNETEMRRQHALNEQILDYIRIHQDDVILSKMVKSYDEVDVFKK